MSAWTSLSPVTVSVEDDELDTSDFEEDDELEDKDKDEAEDDDDEEEYEEFGAEAPREPHHDHPRRGDWNG